MRVGLAKRVVGSTGRNEEMHVEEKESLGSAAGAAEMRKWVRFPTEQREKHDVPAS